MRFVVPTSTRRAPERASTSGMRKPSPISISSPRETTHLAALGERREREQHRRRVVVDDERGLGAGQPAQDRGDVVLARAARAGVEVVLEVRVAAADLAHALERRLGERRPAEVRVHDHAGRVEDAPQAGARARRRAPRAPARQVARLAAGADLLPRPLEHRARGLDREWVARPVRARARRPKAGRAAACGSLGSGVEATLEGAVRRLPLLLRRARRLALFPRPRAQSRRASSQRGRAALPGHGIEITANAGILIDAGTAP